MSSSPSTLLTYFFFYISTFFYIYLDICKKKVKDICKKKSYKSGYCWRWSRVGIIHFVHLMGECLDKTDGFHWRDKVKKTWLEKTAGFPL